MEYKSATVVLAERRRSLGFDRLTLIVTAGVVGLVVAAVTIAALSRGRDVAPDLGTPEGVVLAYTQAEARGDGAAAWDLLAASAHARGNRDQFIARVGSGDSGISRSAYVSTEAAHIDSGGSNASVVLVRSNAGSGGLFSPPSSSIRTTVRLTLQDGAWRITVPPDDYSLIPPRAAGDIWGLSRDRASAAALASV
ncbi:MAG: hypothetical protein NVSMB2_14100 [Chloroflexota bacterium]